MTHLHLFTDGSVNTTLKFGYGAYLLAPQLGESIDSLNRYVKVKRFDHTSSSRLELQTLLWALDEVVVLYKNMPISVTAYTDSQNILRLPARQSHLEQTQFISSNEKILKNHDLYKAFFLLALSLRCEFVKVDGHKKSSQKDSIDRIFSLVDQASRRALREDTKVNN